MITASPLQSLTAHLSEAGDGRVLVSHAELDEAQESDQHELESLTWEEFFQVQHFLYVWSAAQLGAAMGSEPEPMTEGVCAFARDPTAAP
jgi:hypothetical protein